MYSPDIRSSLSARIDHQIQWFFPQHSPTLYLSSGPWHSFRFCLGLHISHRRATHHFRRRSGHWQEPAPNSKISPFQRFGPRRSYRFNRCLSSDSLLERIAEMDLPALLLRRPKHQRSAFCGAENTYHPLHILATAEYHVSRGCGAIYVEVGRCAKASLAGFQHQQAVSRL